MPHLLSATFVKAKQLKQPFEEQVLKALVEACSHHEIWLELHPREGPTNDAEEQATARPVIEANLKAKGRAREKALMDYNGDFK